MEYESFYKYWGKARKQDDEGAPYHLLPYHCLDVAAVADIWWQQSESIRRAFCANADQSESITKAWVLFFIALHDYGKLDMRFQLKSPKAVEELYTDFDREMTDLSGVDIQRYYHGPVGYSLLYADLQTELGWSEYDETVWEAWQPWLAAVAGHHGVIPSDNPDYAPQIPEIQADKSIIEHDRVARVTWVSALESHFLTPHGLSIYSLPPNVNAQLAGFCSVADWLGSNSEEGAFEYQSKSEPLASYYQHALRTAERLLQKSGLLSTKQPYQGVKALLPQDEGVVPRQLQTLVDDLPVESGLTIIEAPTGSGKTETALAYAWQLLENDLADSIIFALPTQATANAMLKRLYESAPLIFAEQPNLVLAHGKASFNDDFWQLKEAYQQKTEQGEVEARAQCAQWLSNSRKRVFLGQIGVCTIDQVLISVLSVRHKFVRGFGIGKSVLIVDEVHAYDSYMYGLLGEVLRQQKAMKGSAILLSATLPQHQREALCKTWGGRTEAQQIPEYPLVTHVDDNAKHQYFDLPEKEQPELRMVEIDVVEAHELLPSNELQQKMIQAAQQGAQVVFICNLVDVAQALAKQLKQQDEITVDLFHARYRFIDRQTIEKQILGKYGKEGERTQGSILIATQVVEQSLDLDFDWMIAQLCPVDLLFQRLGRLHRHQRSRPADFAQPRCSILIPDDEDYGYHGLIYGNTRVLWRTAQMLQGAQGEINFPTAYREWIERVYQEDEWGDEPADMLASYDKYLGDCYANRAQAQMLINSEMNEFDDDDTKISALTRSGDMSLNVLPVLESTKGDYLLDGTPINDIEEWWKDEQLNLNMVSVPLKSWSRFLPVGEGLTLLPLSPIEEEWQGEFNGVTVRYSHQYGLEKEDSNG